MSIKYLTILFVAVVLAFAACTKEAQQPAPSTAAQGGSVASYPIAGTWQQTKLVTYLLAPAGNRLYDTTYLAPFTANDFAEFKNDGTCAVSVDHYYYLNEPNMSTPTPISPLKTDFFFKPAGSKYVMVSQINMANPGGFSSADTISMPDNNTLLIHTVGTTLGVNLYISDSYYTKSQ